MKTQFEFFVAIMLLASFEIPSFAAEEDGKTFTGEWNIRSRHGTVVFAILGPIVDGQVKIKITEYTGDNQGFKSPTIVTGNITKNGKKLTVNNFSGSDHLSAKITSGGTIISGRYCAGSLCGKMTVKLSETLD
jgi:hypothetical protein